MPQPTIAVGSGDIVIFIAVKQNLAIAISALSFDFLARFFCFFICKIIIKPLFGMT